MFVVNDGPRLRNNACSPPIIMMQSYRFYRHGAHQSLLRTSVSTRSLFGPDYFEHDNYQAQRLRTANIICRVCRICSVCRGQPWVLWTEKVSTQVKRRREGLVILWVSSCKRVRTRVSNRLRVAAICEIEETAVVGHVTPTLTIILTQGIIWETAQVQSSAYTVNAWRFVILDNLIKFEVPVIEHWPFEKKWNPLEIILNQDIIDEQLMDTWQRARMFSKGDDMSYLRKPPE